MKIDLSQTYSLHNRDPETIARQKELEKKEKMDKDDEERMMDFIERQVRLTHNSRVLRSNERGGF